MAAALDAGAEDVVTNDDGSIDVLTDPSEYERVRDAMSQGGAFARWCRDHYACRHLGGPRRRAG